MPHQSLNARLATIALLALIACGASVVALTLLHRSGAEQRSARAEQQASASVLRLRSGRPVVMRARRGGRAGVLSPQGYVLEGTAPPPAAQRAIREITDVDDIATAMREDEGEVQSAAALRDEQGRVYWAMSAINVPPRQPLLRLAVLVLALSGLASAVLAIRTARSVRDGARSLSDSVDRLSKSLAAPVDTPAVGELAVVADRVRLMAAALVNAQGERDALTRQLAAKDRLAALGRMSAGVAHEVRNPLAAMKLRVDLARRSEGLSSDVRADLDELSSEIARLDRLVVDLLALSRARPPERKQRSLGEIARNRAGLLQTWADEKNVAIEVEGDATAWVDEDQLSRAIDNLARNAIEASPRGRSVRVCVAQRGALCEISVRDLGPGVARDREQALFEPFFTTKSDGTGLGLALARATAEAHGGALAYRREGIETVFALTVTSGAVGHSVTP
jgi:signal transduction histidine kinase